MTTPAPIAPAHLGLVLFAVVNWGLSFVVIRVGLNGVPPMLLAALRFAFSAFPAVLFVPRPKIAWRWLALYGTAIGVLQFGSLFYAMQVGMSAGLASLVIQSQVFFTVLLASAVFNERIAPNQWLGLGLAFLGIALIATNGNNSTTLQGLVFTLLGALGWAIANLTVRHISSLDARTNMLGVVVHGSLYAPLPLLLAAFSMNGPERVLHVLSHPTLASGLSVLYLALVATVLCFGAWAWLIARYGAGRVTPFALLVPVFGMAFSAVLLQEHYGTPQILAASLVVLGLLVNVFGTRFLKTTTPPTPQKETP